MKTEATQGKENGFLIKTYQMLENPEFNHIVSWNPLGPGFIIFDLSALAEKVLPVYFKHSNFHSFVRQLNMYGFSKIRTTNDQNHYSHPLFKQGEKHLIRKISRKVQNKMKKTPENKSIKSVQKRKSDSQLNNNNNKPLIESFSSESSQKSIDLKLQAPQPFQKTIGELNTNVDVATNPSQRNTGNVSASPEMIDKIKKILSLNACLLQQQAFLYQDIKRQWSRMERVVPTNVQLLNMSRAGQYSLMNSTTMNAYPFVSIQSVLQDHQIYCDRKAEAVRSIDGFLELNQRLIKKVYEETRNLVQDQEQLVLPSRRVSMPFI